MKKIIILQLLLISSTCFSQNDKKLKKNFRTFVSESFDPKSSISFTNDKDPGDFRGALKNAFISNGLKVVSETSIDKKAELNTHSDSSNVQTSFSNTKYVKARYLVTFQYKYVNIPNKGTVQCTDIRGQIVDLKNDSEVVATFSYVGRFDVDPVAEAIAINLKSK